ncbi:hypothetical protein SLE2022_260420 [Rubroshorea leprosula]
MCLKRNNLHFFLCVFLLLLVSSPALNTDGVLLLSFKYSILNDPLSVLQNWHYNDETPCSWNGVTCTDLGSVRTPDMFRVTGLVLPNSQLLGSIPAELGYLEHLRHLDLSNNLFNGSLPGSLFNSTELRVLSLSGNMISGGLPEFVSVAISLQFLNLSDNALFGKVPENITALKNLTIVSLRSNYFTGGIPSEFGSVQVLDLSSNLLNGSLPLDFGGDNLRYLNLSYNKISGSIWPKFAKRLPQNATIDLSFNNLEGAIPESLALLNQKAESFSGNVGLCGKPLKNLCSIPWTLSTPQNVSTTSISPAIAVIPKQIASKQGANRSSGQNNTRGRLKPGTIAAITVADLAGIAILGMIILYVYQLKIRKKPNRATGATNSDKKTANFNVLFSKCPEQPPESSSCSCIRLKLKETSETGSSSEGTINEMSPNPAEPYQKRGKLVTVDGETQLELETLLKASAYILGTSGSSIVYKAVLVDGKVFAVRRIGESCVKKLKDFDTQVRIIAKLRHPNLVRLRGFYWGDDEKLVIYDYIPNGSLTTAGNRRASSSPSHLSLEARLKIASGVARGLAYIHERRQVHGNIKPSNILLSSDMEPIISDLGLDRLTSAENNSKPSGAGRFLDSQQSTSSRDGPLDHTTSLSSCTSAGSSTRFVSLYQAPESLKNLKPNPKWDVYSFGMILLELLTGRVFTDWELSQWAVATGSVVEEKNRVLRLVDAPIRGEVEAKEEALLACFKLGFQCASLLPQKRPSMKGAIQVLEKIPPTTLC